ncbi:MAG: hypothetical protein OHK0013_11550 [Sandaracinaceae bacterium]
MRHVEHPRPWRAEILLTEGEGVVAEGRRELDERTGEIARREARDAVRVEQPPASSTSASAPTPRSASGPVKPASA